MNDLQHIPLLSSLTNDVPDSGSITFEFEVPRDEYWAVKSIGAVVPGNSVIDQITIAGVTISVDSSELTDGVYDLEAKFGSLIKAYPRSKVQVQVTNPDAGVESNVVVTVVGIR